MIRENLTPIDITRKFAKYGLVAFNRVFDHDDVFKLKNKINNAERVLFQL